MTLRRKAVGHVTVGESRGHVKFFIFFHSSPPIVCYFTIELLLSCHFYYKRDFIKHLNEEIKSR
jgi:hypothetical protein